MITPYPHQSKMISETRDNMRRFKRVLLQSPTGSGKTVMALIMHGNAYQRGKTSFFICHRRELINQTAKTFAKNGLEFGIIAAGHPKNYDKKIQICSIDTLKNRLDEIPDPDLCVWDECQHIAANGWAKTQEHFLNSYHIGLSATPERLSGEGLDAYFDALVLGPPVRWLIDNGFLAEYRLFSVPGVDMSGAGVQMGEYVTADAEQAMDKPAIVGDIVKHWLLHASDKVTIGFAPSVKMSKKFAEAFNNAGIPAAHLDAKTPDEERFETLQAFARCEIQVLFNKALFTEGFDIAANSGIDVTIGCVIDAAPTKSVPLWMQRCGRGLRMQEGKAIILDHAGNAMALGLPCQQREWSLVSAKRKKRDVEPDVLVKQCLECFCCHKPAPVCPECGFLYPVIERKIDEKEGELVEITQEQQEKKQARMIQGQAKTVQQLVATGMGRNRAIHIVKAREAKEALQNELMGLHGNISISEVKKMKPKELKLMIKELKCDSQND